jgi:hypothetical protein
MAIPSTGTRLLAETMKSRLLFHLCTELAFRLVLKDAGNFKGVIGSLREAADVFAPTLDPRPLLPGDPYLDVDFGREIARREAGEVLTDVGEHVWRRLAGPKRRISTTLQTPPRRNVPKA